MWEEHDDEYTFDGDLHEPLEWATFRIALEATLFDLKRKWNCLYSTDLNLFFHFDSSSVSSMNWLTQKLFVQCVQRIESAAWSR